MTKYNLPGVPNQTFEIQLEGYLFSFALRTFRDSMFMDVAVDDEIIVTGLRVVNGQNILPRHIADTVSGNFQFRVVGGDYPDYNLIGDGFAYLVFLEYGEM